MSREDGPISTDHVSGARTDPRTPRRGRDLSMAGWSKWAQRAVWSVAALPFGLTIVWGGPVVATLIALWLRRGGRRRDPPWRLLWFVGVSWLLLGGPLALHFTVASIDWGVERLRRTEFDSATWVRGDADVRTTMAHDLVESGMLVGVDWESSHALLGRADTVLGGFIPKRHQTRELSGYDLTRGGFGYRDAVNLEIARPMLVLEWHGPYVSRASIGSYMKGRPFPAPRPDDPR